jgi:hypothetical protein
MDESISVTSSIVGIVAAAGKIVQLLRQIGQTIDIAQPAASALISEVHNSTLSLTALQIIFDGSRSYTLSPARPHPS